MDRSREWLAHAVACAWMVGCAHVPVVPPDRPPEEQVPPTEAELEAWEDAAAVFARHDEAQDWDGDACRETVGAFERVSAQREGQNGRAVYMMGLVAARCGSDERATQLYRRALELEPGLCDAQVGLAIVDLEAGRVAEARRGFVAAIRADELCAPAYVNLAALQASDPAQREEALNNLRRALSARADYLPALDQMAQIYLASGAENPAMLDLAEVVCRQAQLVDAGYAPIYNTWGLIDMTRGDLTGAAAKLARATELDPRFYEAWMNFGQLTLSQRAYPDAARAFHAARALRPRSYDAAIGEGVAMRGLTRPEDAERLYRAALELDSDRPEAYFDLAVLYQEHLGGSQSQLEQAEDFLRQFVERARRSPRFEGAVDEVLRWCDETPSRRRRRAQCQMGRVQNIRQAVVLMSNQPGPATMPEWLREARAAR